MIDNRNFTIGERPALSHRDPLVVAEEDKAPSSENRRNIIGLLNAALAAKWARIMESYQLYFITPGILVEVAKGEFLLHTREELEHAHILVERIIQLGGEPNLNVKPVFVASMTNRRRPVIETRKF